MPDWSNFREINRQQWMMQASQDSKGNTDIQHLVYQMEGVQGFSPFLTAEEGLFLPPVDTPSTLPGVRIVEETAVRANEMALRMLERGAGCLWFDVLANWALKELLADIFLEMVPVILNIPGKSETFFAELQAVRQQMSAEAKVNLLITGNQEIETHHMIRLNAKHDFRSRAQQIHQAMQSPAVDDKKSVLLEVELKTDFFAQVAELRFIHQCHQLRKETYPLFIVAKPGPVLEEWSEIHPMIPVTYQLLSAHLGMAHAAFGLDTSMGEELCRISLHCQHILQEEGKTAIVSDPLAGSYLTDQMIQLLDQA